MSVLMLLIVNGGEYDQSRPERLSEIGEEKSNFMGRLSDLQETVCTKGNKKDQKNDGN